jgi:hypothetical protein
MEKIVEERKKEKVKSKKKETSSRGGALTPRPRSIGPRQPVARLPDWFCALPATAA